jgi:hypothetical protein
MDITGLPDALVNGKRVHGAAPLATFVSAVEAARAL